jgi:hypothetical protein
MDDIKGKELYYILKDFQNNLKKIYIRSIIISNGNSDDNEEDKIIARLKYLENHYNFYKEKIPIYYSYMCELWSTVYNDCGNIYGLLLDIFEKKKDNNQEENLDLLQVKLIKIVKFYISFLKSLNLVMLTLVSTLKVNYLNVNNVSKEFDELSNKINGENNYDESEILLKNNTIKEILDELSSYFKSLPYDEKGLINPSSLSNDDIYFIEFSILMDYKELTFLESFFDATIPGYILKFKESGLISGGRKKPTNSTKTKPNGKHDDMKMKDIKELCKANKIKLSRIVEGKYVVFKKKELITKLKRNKLL